MSPGAKRAIQRAGWGAVGFALVYVVWVYIQRSASNWEAERRAQRVRRARELHPSVADPSPGVKILQFYASQPELKRGERVLICYGVLNAATVRIEPPIEELKPALSRCLETSPARTTTYTLSAEGADGSRARASFTLRVTEPAP